MIPEAVRGLPVVEALPALLAALADPGTAVLEAPPGAGKTTVVPLALLGAPWLAGRKVLVLEPRRLAARAAARRMASLLGEPVGATVGFRVRFETVAGPATRIEVVTEGVLTRLLQQDPSLPGYGAVLFDEFHERSLQGDLGLALALQGRELLRGDLRLAVMSATLDGGRVAALLGGAPVVTSTGRLFPVETIHLPPRPGQRLEDAVAAAIREALRAREGDLLAFLPGAGEIRRVAERLAEPPLPAGVRVRQLHGALDAAGQDAAILPAPAGERKVVLATALAETSLTIEGVRVVVDAGLMRVPRFSPRTGMGRLETVRVTRASAEQRRGRAGRVAPGTCYRLWAAQEEHGFLPFATPEILAADLAPLALDLASAGISDPGELRWLDPPPPAALAQARELLGLLGALDGAGRITPEGKRLAALPLHPRLAHLLLAAADRGLTRLGAALAALLTDRDIARGSGGPPDSDLRLRVERFLGHGSGGIEVDRGGLERARREARELERLVLRAGWRREVAPARPAGTEKVAPPPDETEWSGFLAALAYPDRIAQRRPGAPGRFLLRNGRGAALPPADSLARAEWVVAAAVDDAGQESRILLAAPLAEAEVRALAAGELRATDEVAWDPAAGAVTARRVTRLGAIVVDEQALAEPPPAAVREALVAVLRREGPGMLAWDERATRLRQRMAFLHARDATWPDVSDPALLTALPGWLGARLEAVRRRGDLARIDPGAALLDLLDWKQRAALEDLAPDRWETPAGSRIAIDYSDPLAPVLPVRLQELFGLRETPRIAGGQVPLTLHLLSPAHRPVQVTRDLAGFWKDSYFEVRRELRGRYPKHSWPDDPLQAPPTRKARPRPR